MKGVRDGDTGLFAAGNCLRKKIFRERQTRVEGWHGIVPQAVYHEFCVGFSRYVDCGGRSSAGAAVPRGDASDVSTLHVLPHLIHSSPNILFFYIGWFGVCLVFFTRSYGLYGAIQHRSGLHEQRMTMQATLTSGLLLCGTLYLSNGKAISRIVVALMVVFTTALLCLRRALWRRMVYRRFRAGIETRNVLIVGAGRVGHALRNHIDTLQHLGFRFKGFVALTEREAESGDADVIGDARNCLSLARSLFVDEIFFLGARRKKAGDRHGRGSPSGRH